MPACFEYDGASVPRAVWSYFPPQPLDLSAVFHDWLYRFQGDVPGDSYLVWNPFTRQWAPGRDFGMTWSRRSSDRLFARHLRETPAEWRPSRWERRAAYLAVRAGGPIAWHSATFDLKIKQ